MNSSRRGNFGGSSHRSGGNSRFGGGSSYGGSSRYGRYGPTPNFADDPDPAVQAALRSEEGYLPESYRRLYKELAAELEHFHDNPDFQQLFRDMEDLDEEDVDPYGEFWQLDFMMFFIENRHLYENLFPQFKRAMCSCHRKGLIPPEYVRIMGEYLDDDGSSRGMGGGSSRRSFGGPGGGFGSTMGGMSSRRRLEGGMGGSSSRRGYQGPGGGAGSSQRGFGGGMGGASSRLGPMGGGSSRRDFRGPPTGGGANHFREGRGFGDFSSRRF